MSPSDLDIWAEPLFSSPSPGPAPIARLPGVDFGSLRHFHSDLFCDLSETQEEDVLDGEVSRVSANAARGNLTALLLSDSRRASTSAASNVSGGAASARGPKRSLGSRVRVATPSHPSPYYSDFSRASSSGSTEARWAQSPHYDAHESPVQRNCRSPWPPAALSCTPRLVQDKAADGFVLGTSSPACRSSPVAREATLPARMSLAARDDDLCIRNSLGPHVILRESFTPMPSEKDEYLDLKEAALRKDAEEKKARLWNLTVTQVMWRQKDAYGTARKKNALMTEGKIERQKVVQTPEQQECAQNVSNVWKPMARAKMMEKLTQLAAVPGPGAKQANLKRVAAARVSHTAQTAECDLLRSRQCVAEEGERIADELNDRDCKEALKAFSRYDEDDSGSLELPEIRAVLGDLGLLPETTSEKASVRRTLVNFAQSIKDGESEPEEYMRSTKMPSVALADRRREEHLARNIHITKKNLHDFIARVRARLQATRARRHNEVFRRFDVFESGELDLPTLQKILTELKLFGTEHDEEKTRTFFFEWLSKVACPQDAPPPAEELEYDVPEVWHFGTKELRQLLLGKEIVTAGPFQVCPDTMQRYVLKQLEGRMFDQTEFEVFVDFLQVAKDSIALEKERTGAKEIGISNLRLFLEFRHELVGLRKVFESFDRHGEGEIGESDVWMALNSLGLNQAGHKERLIFARVLDLGCWNYYALPSEEQQQRSLDLSSPSGTDRNWVHGVQFEDDLTVVCPLAAGLRGFLEFPPATETATVTFQGFLTILSHIRMWVHSTMKDELRLLFDRCLRRRCTNGVVSEVLGVREVAMGLEDLKLAPQNAEEQHHMKVFLEDCNEWGFQPVTLDFDTFVRFIRRIREWRAGVGRERERQFASKEYGFKEVIVQEYRVAFDILLEDGHDGLAVSDVRRIFKLLRFNITSELLRELFAKVDAGAAGRINFLEFLKLVHLFNKTKRTRRLISHISDVEVNQESAAPAAVPAAAPAAAKSPVAARFPTSKLKAALSKGKMIKEATEVMKASVKSRRSLFLSS
mmetsp:Transcript_138528/g.442774  ORF Transcript_138528/g.442774 Transcript_138528/m.442774 type:complete len:1038 (+) Transcript_138528:66-3179(+)